MKKISKNSTNSRPFDIQDDKLYQILKLALNDLKEKYNLSTEEIFELLESKPFTRQILIPISVFENKGLSALEIVCKYLKEDLYLNYSRIALLLNRNSRTIWITYRNAVRKRKERLLVKDSKIFIPISVFTNRKLSVLESIVCYLKDKFNLRYSEIAPLINRDERNIWTAYNKAKKKRK